MNIEWEIPSVCLKSGEGELDYGGKENLFADHMSNSITVIDFPDKDTSIFRKNTSR